MTDTKNTYFRVMQTMTLPHVNEIKSFRRKEEPHISSNCTQSGDYKFMINFRRQQPKQTSLSQTRKIHKFRVLVFRTVLN